MTKPTSNPFGDRAVREITSEISRQAKERRERMVSLEVENAALKVRVAELEAEIKRRDEAEPDWWYRDADPDECGDSAYEALRLAGYYNVCLLHSSYNGPSKYAFRALPPPDAEDDDDEILIFDTPEEAMEAAKARAPFAKGEQAHA